MKNKIKTLLLIMIAGMMLITLTGCGDKEENTSKKENKDNDVTQNQTNDDDNTSDFDLGKWNGNVYTNDYLNMKFTLPSGWEAATDKEIAEMMQLGEETLANEGKYVSEVAKLSSVYYASATDTNTGSNIIIMSEKATVSLERYLSSLKTQLQAVSSMKYSVTDEGKVNLGSQEFSTITVAEATYGLDQKYYVREKDGKFVVVIMTSVDGESTFNELEKSFQ